MGPDEHTAEMLSRHEGFIAGITGVPPGADPLGSYGRGHTMGASVRERFVRKPELSSREVLEHVLEQGEHFVAELAAGIADDGQFKDALAVARVHLAETKEES